MSSGVAPSAHPSKSSGKRGSNPGMLFLNLVSYSFPQMRNDQPMEAVGECFFFSCPLNLIFQYTLLFFSILRGEGLGVFHKGVFKLLSASSCCWLVESISFLPLASAYIFMYLYYTPPFV